MEIELWEVCAGTAGMLFLALVAYCWIIDGE